MGDEMVKELRYNVGNFLVTTKLKKKASLIIIDTIDVVQISSEQGAVNMRDVVTFDSVLDTIKKFLKDSEVEYNKIRYGFKARRFVTEQLGVNA